MLVFLHHFLTFLEICINVHKLQWKFHAGIMSEYHSKLFISFQVTYGRNWEIMTHPVLFYRFYIEVMQLYQSSNNSCKVIRKSIFGIFAQERASHAELHKTIHRWQNFVAFGNNLNFWPDVTWMCSEFVTCILNCQTWLVQCNLFKLTNVTPNDNQC